MALVGKVEMAGFVRFPGVAPEENPRHARRLDDRSHDTGEIVRHGNFFHAGLGHHGEFARPGGIVGNDPQVAPHVVHVVLRGGLVRAEVVEVETDHIHPFVAGITFQIARFVLDIGRGVAVEDVVYAACVAQVGDGHPPQRLVVVGRCEIGAPPKPRTGLLVVKAQYDGDRFALRVFQRCEKISHAVQSCEVFVVVRAARQDRSDHVAARAVPRRTAGEDVVPVPADGRDASAGRRCCDSPADVVEIDRVEAVRCAQLDMADLPADDGGIVARHVVNVRKSRFVTLVSVGQGVLLSEHDAPVTEREKTFVKRTGGLGRLRVRRTVFRPGAGRGQQGRARCEGQKDSLRSISSQSVSTEAALRNPSGAVLKQ